MAITFGDRLIDSGYYDITAEQEREIEARRECERRGIDPDDICADGGVTAWMVVDQQLQEKTAMTEVIRYRDYEIRYWMKPVPVRDWDWDWRHKDFDLDDHRYGHSRTLEDAKADIDEQIEDDELEGRQ